MSILLYGLSMSSVSAYDHMRLLTYRSDTVSVSHLHPADAVMPLENRGE